MLRENDIVGTVTSCEYSHTLTKVIGLAYVHPADAEPGSTVTIRTANGVCVQAPIVTLPFYDPDNERQQL